MAVWADFYPRVMPYVIGCPSPTVDTALIDTAREFCKKCRTWETIKTLTVVADQNLYAFPLAAGEEVVKIDRFTVNDEEFTEILSDKDLPSDWQTNPPTDDAIYQKSATEFLIFPAPALTDVVTLTLYLRPTENGTGVDDATFDEHAEAIASGARAKLQRMPRQDWTDLQQAQIDAVSFMTAMHSAANRDFMRMKNHRVTPAGL